MWIWGLGFLAERLFSFLEKLGGCRLLGGSHRIGSDRLARCVAWMCDGVVRGWIWDMGYGRQGHGNDFIFGYRKVFGLG